MYWIRCSQSLHFKYLRWAAVHWNLLTLNRHCTSVLHLCTCLHLVLVSSASFVKSDVRECRTGISYDFSFFFFFFITTCLWRIWFQQDPDQIKPSSYRYLLRLGINMYAMHWKSCHCSVWWISVFPVKIPPNCWLCQTSGWSEKPLWSNSLLDQGECDDKC